jgi:hypothetical protein
VTERPPEPRRAATGEAGGDSPPSPRENAALAALDSAIAELDRTATRLRGGELDPAEAAALVEECADLAARVGSALEGVALAAASAEAPPSGQETLL